MLKTKKKQVYNIHIPNPKEIGIELIYKTETFTIINATDAFMFSIFRIIDYHLKVQEENNYYVKFNKVLNFVYELTELYFPLFQKLTKENITTFIWKIRKNLIHFGIMLCNIKGQLLLKCPKETVDSFWTIMTKKNYNLLYYLDLKMREYDIYSLLGDEIKDKYYWHILQSPKKTVLEFKGKELPEIETLERFGEFMENKSIIMLYPDGEKKNKRKRESKEDLEK